MHEMKIQIEKEGERQPELEVIAGHDLTSLWGGSKLV